MIQIQSKAKKYLVCKAGYGLQCFNTYQNTEYMLLDFSRILNGVMFLLMIGYLVKKMVKLFMGNVKVPMNFGFL